MKISGRSYVAMIGSASILMMSTALFTILQNGESLILPAETVNLSGDKFRADKLNHKLKFYEEKLFLEGVAFSKEKNIPLENYIYGGVIPHHLLPGFILADFFTSLSRQKVRTIILIGPNHPDLGSSRILTSLQGWETPFGVVKPNREIISRLIESKVIQVEETVLENEHSVAGMMPFISYYLPQTTVVPIILKSSTNFEEVKTLAGQLRNYLEKGEAVLIAPVDFSHYLTSREADEKDEGTLSLIEGFDLTKLLTLGSDYLDSPASIATIMLSLRGLGKNKMGVIYHTNSGRIQKDASEKTTSYFSMVFY